MTRRVVATIGHGSASFGLVCGVLQHHGIDTIIDVRSQPYSRHAPDFNRGTLESLTAAAGMGYRWLGEGLGGRPTDPALLHADGTLDADRVTASDAFMSGVTTVAGLAAGGRVALLCAEEDPQYCHRTTLIAPALIADGISVIHLRHDGTAHPNQPSLGI